MVYVLGSKGKDAIFIKLEDGTGRVLKVEDRQIKYKGVLKKGKKIKVDFLDAEIWNEAHYQVNKPLYEELRKLKEQLKPLVGPIKVKGTIKICCAGAEEK